MKTLLALALALSATTALADGVPLLLKDQKYTLQQSEGEHLGAIKKEARTRDIAYVGKINPNAVDARLIEIELQGKVWHFAGSSTRTERGGDIWTGKDGKASLLLIRNEGVLVGSITAGPNQYRLRPVGKGGAYALVRTQDAPEGDDEVKK
jgi:hypothetical protein